MVCRFAPVVVPASSELSSRIVRNMGMVRYL
jgi:hypothetical protein